MPFNKYVRRNLPFPYCVSLQKCSCVYMYVRMYVYMYTHTIQSLIQLYIYLHAVFCYTVRVAALRRATKPPSTIPSSPTGLHLQVSRLDDLCVKLLVRRSRDYGLPNCTGLSSAVAESLITALATNKILKPKTLGAFSKWLEPLLYCIDNAWVGVLYHTCRLQRLCIYNCYIAPPTSC